MMQPPNLRVQLQRSCSLQLNAMKTARLSWQIHWAAVADMYLPRRYKWLVTPNLTNRGSPINSQIVDETGVVAARTLASGMMSGLTSPTRPWFRLGLHGLDEVPYGPTKLWLAEVERRMMLVFSQSNFYTSLATLYHDLGVFGSASALLYEDDVDIIRCFNPCLGEFYFGVDAALRVSTHGREFTWTIQQTVAQFGLENCSAQVQDRYKQGGAALSQEVLLGHVIEKNTELYAESVSLGYPVPKVFPWRECYYEVGKGDESYLSCKGFYEKPFLSARWDTVSNDPYGRSPGMDALPATRQLQIEQRRKAEAIDKIVRPPMNASVNMRNEPVSILPGAVNYVADLANSGFKPAYQIDPRINEMTQDIAEVQARIKSVFFVDLFMMISELNTVRTATEIDARREEKLVQLGPVIERFENEVLDPAIDRVFGIMARRGLLPPAPPEIAGAEINVQYVSMLAEAQRAAATASIERLMSFAGNLVGVFPQIVDNVDEDAAIDEYANLLNTTPKIIRATKDVMAIRAEKAKQQQAQQLAEVAPGTAQAAKTLSETQVGGGQSALGMMMGQAA